MFVAPQCGHFSGWSTSETCHVASMPVENSCPQDLQATMRNSKRPSSLGFPRVLMVPQRFAMVNPDAAGTASARRMCVLADDAPNPRHALTGRRATPRH